MEELVMRRDISVDYHQESGTWGVRIFNEYGKGHFVSWGASSPHDCKNLPYYHYPF
jgi:hypothetical protein